MKGSLLRGVFCLILAGSLVGVFAYPIQALGVSQASIFVGPASGTFTVGSTFTVSVYLNTGGQSVNAIEANLSFPPDKLQVVSPTAGKSLIQVWVNQPTFSNSEGNLKFQGAIPTPGVNTDSGVISTITFRVKNTGVAAVKVLDSSRVLLNDGRGTDVLGQTTSGVYNLILPPPAGPIVTSPTNPDQEKWYSSKSAVFSWEAAPGTEGFSYVLNNSPIDDPDNISEGLKTKISYNDLTDDVYYFHIKSLREGSWGGVTSYAVRIDSTPPANFEINISPDSYTSNRRPIIDFETTDQTSGIDHYELKIISLDPKVSGEADSSANETPFFIEATSPYSRSFDLGRYDVVVRAYDVAGNYFQAIQRMTIANAIFEIVRGQGLRLGGAFILAWPYAIALVFVLLLALGYFARKAWIWHRQIEKHFEAGVVNHPMISEKLNELKDKQREYGKTNDFGAGLKSLLILVILSAAFAGFWLKPGFSFAEEPVRVPVEPPVVTLFPRAISNDEILYIGGFARIPGAEVIIYTQDEDNGSAQSYSVKTDKSGSWFFSFAKFLKSGHYSIWTQLKVGEELSPPSSRIDLAVAPTAIQFGENRLNFQDFYLILFAIFSLGFLALLAFTVYHFYNHQVKNRRFLKELREAEESIRRGFVVLRRDIEDELAIIRRLKLSKELAVEEKLKEDKLIKDLESINNYVGKEVWDIEKELK